MVLKTHTLPIRSTLKFEKDRLYDMIDAYVEGHGFVYGELDGSNKGRLASVAGIIVSINRTKETAEVQLLEGPTFWAAEAVRVLCVAQRPPTISPVVMLPRGGEGRVSAMGIRPFEPKP